MIQIPPSHGSQSKQANLCPVHYATGGILNLPEIFDKLLVQEFSKIFRRALLSLKMMVKQNCGPHLLIKSTMVFTIEANVGAWPVYATGAEF